MPDFDSHVMQANEPSRSSTIRLFRSAVEAMRRTHHSAIARISNDERKGDTNERVCHPARRLALGLIRFNGRPALVRRSPRLAVVPGWPGKLQPVKSEQDWSRRVEHIRTNMELVMGRLPEKSTLPLDMMAGGTTQLQHYTRQKVSFVVEEGDRQPGWLLIPHGAVTRAPLPRDDLPAGECGGGQRDARRTDGER